MMKYFATLIAVPVLLGSATASIAGEVPQINAEQIKKVNVGTYINTPTSTGAKLGGGISDTARPKPHGPGGQDALQAPPGINLGIETRVRPRPRGPGGTEALPQINPVNQIQH